MKIKINNGVDVILTGDEVARAMHTYLVAKGVAILGPVTTTVNGELCKKGKVHIDPIGFCIDKNGKKWEYNVQRFIAGEFSDSNQVDV